MRFSPTSLILIAFFSGLVSGILVPRAEVTCKLQLAQGSTSLKYISSNLNAFGEYGILTDLATDALEVTLNSGNNPGQLDLKVTGADADTPMLGGITGFFDQGDDLTGGSYHYAYIGLTSQTTPGSAPQTGTNSFDKIQGFERKIESAIWSYDPTTKQVAPQWVNTDKSTPTNYLIYVDKQNAVIITADKERFLEEFKEEFKAQGANPIEVTINCI